MKLSFKDEFQLNKFCLTFADPSVFGTSQWGWPQPVFVVYRLVAASYVIGWNIYGYVTIPTFGHHVTIVFYTNWSYLVLALHLTLALLVTLYHSACRGRHQQVRQGRMQATPGSHVITICGGACAEIPGSVLHYHLQEFGRQEKSANSKVPMKKKQRKVVDNNNEYIADDERAPRCRPDGGGACDGAVGVSTSRGKQRSKQDIRGHGVDRKGSSNRKSRSVGVNCGASKRHTDAVTLSHDMAQTLKTRPEDTASPHTATGSNIRQHGRKTRRLHSGHTRDKTESGHFEDISNTCGLHPGYGRERKQRHRRQAKGCHRRGKAVGFKYKSSNSSLDKIRSRAGRRCLTPEVKRRGRRSLRGGGKCSDGPPPLPSAPPAGSSEPSGAVVATWQTDVERGDKGRACVDTASSYRAKAALSGSRHRRLGSRQAGRPAGQHQQQGRGHWGVRDVGVELLPSQLVTESENHRLRSTRKGKHTFILQRSRGVRQQLASCADPPPRDSTTATAAAAAAVSTDAASPRDAAGSRGHTTRSVGTNTSGAAGLPQRISVIVENSAALRPAAADTTDTTAGTLADVGGRQPLDLPLYIKVSWVVFNMAAASAPVVSSVYFLVLFPMLQREQPSFRTNVLDLNLHAINSLIVLLEVLVAAFPVRLLHCVYPLIYGLTYVVFSAGYWAMDKERNVLYPVILDWNQPSVTVPVVLGLVLLATPVIQLLWYGVYRLRLCVYDRLCCKKQSSNGHVGPGPGVELQQQSNPSSHKETQV